MKQLPCEVHGHPAHLPEDLAAWIDMYNIIAPYSTQTGVLDHSLISKLCDGFGIDFLRALDKMLTIQRFARDRDAHKNERIQNGSTKDEGKG